MSIAPNTPALENQKMNQDVFTQLYQSLSPNMGSTPAQDSQSVFDEWLKQDFLSEYSANSPPEINTPLDQFLMSPPYQAKEDINNAKNKDQTFMFEGVDLDVSAILDYPQIYSAQTTTPNTPPATDSNANNTLTTTTTVIKNVTTPESTTPVTPSISAASVNAAVSSGPAAPTPATTDPVVSMSNLFADIGSSLPAALAALAAVAAPTTTVKTTTSSVSPAVVSASTPAFSASPSRTRKRAEDIDPTDEAAVKRQKNTDAARRSRLRKVQKMECLETRVAELEKLNAGLLMRIAVLDSEKTNLKAKESTFENRIKVLEHQLTEAHRVLSTSR